MKKDFLNGLYPSKDFRDQRIKEIQRDLDILISNRESLNNTINQLLFELNIIKQMDQLEDFIDGKITIEPKGDNPQ